VTTKYIFSCFGQFLQHVCRIGDISTSDKTTKPKFEIFKALCYSITHFGDSYANSYTCFEREKDFLMQNLLFFGTRMKQLRSGNLLPHNVTTFDYGISNGSATEYDTPNQTGRSTVQKLQILTQINTLTRAVVSEASKALKPANIFWRRVNVDAVS